MGTRMRCIAVLVGAMGITVDVAAAQGDNSSLVPSQGTDASELRSFEKSVRSATKEKEQKKPRTESSHDRKHDDGIGHELAEEFADGLMNVAMDFLSDGGRSTLQRLDPETDYAVRRKEGEPLTAFVRYDFGYQRVSADITARFNRLEGGYGPVALFLENYAFNESSPASSLNIKRKMLLYRMSDNEVEIDIGLGQSVITGVERTVINAVPVRFRVLFSESISMDVMASWGGGMDDYEMAMHLGRQFGAVKVGYRSLHSAGPSLGGPFAGVAFYF